MAFLYKNLKKYETSVDANFDKKKRSRNQTRKIRKSGIGFFDTESSTSKPKSISFRQSSLKRLSYMFNILPYSRSWAKSLRKINLEQKSLS